MQCIAGDLGMVERISYHDESIFQSVQEPGSVKGRDVGALPRIDNHSFLFLFFIFQADGFCFFQPLFPKGGGRKHFHPLSLAQEPHEDTVAADDVGDKETAVFLGFCLGCRQSVQHSFQAGASIEETDMFGSSAIHILDAVFENAFSEAPAVIDGKRFASIHKAAHTVQPIDPRIGAGKLFFCLRYTYHVEIVL